MNRLEAGEGRDVWPPGLDLPPALALIEAVFPGNYLLTLETPRFLWEGL